MVLDGRSGLVLNEEQKDLCNALMKSLNFGDYALSVLRHNKEKHDWHKAMSPI
ncbi:MAG: hypothetical protein HRK26_02585 [Rickettsiaceae bacterium H1]|nr:hypothetical protein [Rickettsiaceae bacterium H1]